MLNDDEIVTSVQEESEPVDDETDEDEDNNNERFLSTPEATAPCSCSKALLSSSMVLGADLRDAIERAEIHTYPMGLRSGDIAGHFSH
ncbi:hypothetical protein TNCV_2155471 [Trichonephila clavipes]|nr:hypothetical protein TNCV_2155471 [Trichonephila clavipes]